MKKLAKILISILISFRIFFLNYASKFENIYLKKDSDHYIKLSNDISYSFFNDNLYNYWLSTFRMPGYPLILNVFHKIVDTRFLIYINFIADLITLWILYKVLNKYVNEKYVYVGLILYLLNPNALISSTQIMTESISTTLFFVTFYFFVEKKYVFTSFSLGLLGIVKPLGHYLLFLFLLLLLLKKNKSIINYLKISIFPIIFIGFILVNNYIQYESTFYSTSSYFHLQWLNEASKSLCNNGDFNNPIVSEPGYVFENWLHKNNLTTKSESSILIKKLKNNASNEVLENLSCKAYSMARSSVWNLFGIRRANWSDVGLDYTTLNITLIFSLIYTVLINLSLTFSLYRAVKNKKIDLNLIIIIFYIIISSTLPFGNSRTRVLIEPFLIFSFIDNINYIVNKKSDKSYF